MTKWTSDFFNKFHIGAYYLQKNARTEKHIKDLSSCGIDFLVGIDYDERSLDLFNKHGISIVLSGLLPL